MILKKKPFFGFVFSQDSVLVDVDMLKYSRRIYDCPETQSKYVQIPDTCKLGDCTMMKIGARMRGKYNEFQVIGKSLHCMTNCDFVQ